MTRITRMSAFGAELLALLDAGRQETTSADATALCRGPSRSSLHPRATKAHNATGLCRGGSRLPLQETLAQRRMPRPCAVDRYARLWGRDRDERNDPRHGRGERKGPR